MSIIEVKNLQVNYEHVEALRNVTINIERGDFVAIIGPNGGGKSTLVKTLLGFVKPSSGSAIIAKTEKIGYVPQTTSFDKNFPISVKDTIQMGFLNKKISMHTALSNEQRDLFNKIIKRLRIDDLEKRQIGNLSGGQFQKVLIARALINSPSILILDEPTSGVDEPSKNEIYNILYELNKSNLTIIMITHEIRGVLPFIDNLIYVNKTAHFHDDIEDIRKGYEIDNDCCPIDWYMQGEEINKNLLKSKGDTK